MVRICWRTPQRPPLYPYWGRRAATDNEGEPGPPVQAEQELRESEERFRQISENMHEMVVLLDHANDEVLYVNPVFEEIWGHPCESLYNNPALWVRVRSSRRS